MREGGCVIRVLVEVGHGSACFRVPVSAPSIQVAVGIANARYPDNEVRVLFPIEPEGFFIEGESCPHDEVESAVCAGEISRAGRP